MEQSFSRIKYIDSECLQVTFSYLIIKVESINQKFGQLSEFSLKHDLYGATNGKLYILAEMVQPHQGLIDLITKVLKPLGFNSNEDYVLGYEQLTAGARGETSPLLNKDIPDLEGVNWLGSIIKHKGNFVWFRDVHNWEVYSEWRQEEHPQMGLGYYQMVLTKYLKKYNPEKLVFDPKVIEFRNEEILFGMSKHKGVLQLKKETLDQFFKKEG